MVGVYRLIMKTRPDNVRSSSSVGIIEWLLAARVSLVLHEPLLIESLWSEVTLIDEFEQFKQELNIIDC